MTEKDSLQCVVARNITDISQYFLPDTISCYCVFFTHCELMSFLTQALLVPFITIVCTDKFVSGEDRESGNLEDLFLLLYIFSHDFLY